MAAPRGGKLTNDQIIKDFIYKVSNLVEYASLKSDHPLFSRRGSLTVGSGGSRTSGNSDPGGHRTMTVSTYGGGSHNSPIGKPLLTDLGAIGSMPIANNVVTILKGWMEEYAKVRRVNLRNTGNSFLNTSTTNFVIRFNTANATKLSNIRTQFDADSAVITPGSIIDSEIVNEFINKCQENWINNCHTAATETLAYNYCHSNHVNHANHGSRGRR